MISQSIPSLPSIVFFSCNWFPYLTISHIDSYKFPLIVSSEIDFGCIISSIWLFLNLIPSASAWLFPLQLTDAHPIHLMISRFDTFSFCLIVSSLIDWYIILTIWWFLNLIPSTSLHSLLCNWLMDQSSIWIWRTDVFIPSIMYNLNPLLGADVSSR